MKRDVYLYQCCVLSHPELLDVLAALPESLKSSLTYIYFESEAAIELLLYRTPEPDWLHGRAFGTECEVRWDKKGLGWELLLLAEREISLSNPWHYVSEADGVPLPDTAIADQILLWGTHISKLQYPHHLAGGNGRTWIETRIPRPLQYPVDETPPPAQVKARVVHYYCRDRLLLTRMVALEGEYDEPQILW